MVFKSKKGYYEIITNFKNAFNLANFEEAYIEECFDKYPYVVGDLSDNILRLKGFSTDAKILIFIKILIHTLKSHVHLRLLIMFCVE